MTNNTDSTIYNRKQNNNIAFKQIFSVLIIAFFLFGSMPMNIAVAENVTLNGSLGIENIPAPQALERIGHVLPTIPYPIEDASSPQDDVVSPETYLPEDSPVENTTSETPEETLIDEELPVEEENNSEVPVKEDIIETPLEEEEVVLEDEIIIVEEPAEQIAIEEIIILEELTATALEYYNGTSWNAMSSLSYNEVIEQVRVDCTNDVNQSDVANATFTAVNVPDSNYTINGVNATSNTNELFIFNNSDFAILDSGNWYFEALCTLINTSTDSINSTVLVPWGTLNVTVLNTSAHAQVQQNEFFTLNTSVTCTGGECQDVVVYMDPKESKTTVQNSRSIANELVQEVASQITPTEKTAVLIILKDPVVGRSSAMQQNSFAESISNHIDIKDRFETFSGLTVLVDEEGLNELINNDLVENIEPVRRMHTMMNTVNPIIGSDNMWSHQINEVNITGEGVTVCIIDTGINYSHSDFDAVGSIPNDIIIGSICFAEDEGSDGQPNLTNNPVGSCPNNENEGIDVADDEGHGSHVAGIIASQDATYKGVAPDAQLVIVKALDSNGLGWNFDIIKGIDWCVANKDLYNISIISMSIGEGGYESVSACESANGGFTTAIDAAHDENITVFVASGNSQNVNSSYYNKVAAPACVGSAIPIGAVDNSDNMAYYAQAGPLLEIVAPGGLVSEKVDSTNYQGGHIGKFGTSMATPVVAGMAALLTQYKQEEFGEDTYPSELKRVILANGVNIDDTLNSGYNYTRVNIADANNILGWDPKGLISTNVSATPFYTTDSNPQNNSTGAPLSSMYNGEVVYLTWDVNATGDYDTWEFFAYAEDITTTEVESSRFDVEIYDGTIPTLSNLLPDDNDLDNSALQTFQFNVSDAHDANLTCELFINNTVENTTIANVDVLSSMTFTLSDGTYLWYVNCTDAYGNNVASSARNLVIDASTPQYTPISASPNGIVNVPTSITISANWSDNDLQNVSLYFGNNTLIETQTTSGGLVSFTWNASVDYAEDNVSFYMIGRDTINENMTANTSYVFVNSDNIAPVTVLVSPANNTWETSNPVEFNYNTSDEHRNITSCKLYTDGALKKTNATTVNESSTNIINRTVNGGTHTWNIRCYDDVGNDAYSTETRTVKVDTQDPITSITGVYEGFVYNTARTIRLLPTEQGDSGLNLTRYKMDSGSWTNYTTTISYNTTGTHTIYYHSTDLAGNNETLQNVTFTIDMLAPTITSISPVTGENISDTFVVSGNLTSSSHTFIKIDGTIVESINDSSVNYSSQAIDTNSYSNGAHTVSVVAYDAAGNSETTDISVVFDNSKPISSIVLPTSGTITNTSINVSGTTSDSTSLVETFELYNGTAWETIVPTSNSWSKVITFVGEGEHVLKSRATDYAGNVEVVDQIVVVTLDTTPATISTVRTSANPIISGTTLTVEASIEDTNGVSAVTATINGTATSLTETTSNLYEGTITSPSTDSDYAITITATDNAGNIALDSAYSLEVNSSKPTISIMPVNGSFITNTTSITISVPNKDSAYYNTSTNGTHIAISGSLANLTTSLANGTFSVFVWANSSTGAEANTTRIFTTDNTPPVLVRESLTSITTIPGIIVQGNVTELNKQSLKVNNVLMTLSGNNYTRNMSLSEGNNTITVVATDKAGNSATNATIVLVDTITPETTYTLSGTAGTNSWYQGNVNITFSVDDGIASSGTFTEYWNSSAWVNADSLVITSTDTIIFRSNDTAGHVESNQTTSQINIDSGVPSITNYSISNSIPEINETVSFSAVLADNNSGLSTSQTVLIDGTTYNMVHEGLGVYTYAYVPTTLGTFDAVLTATDMAGKTLSETINFSVAIKTEDIGYDFVNDSANVRDYENEIDTELEINVNETVTGNLSISKFATAPEFVNISLQYAPIYLDYEVSDNLNNNIQWVIIKIFYNEADISGIDESQLVMYWYNKTSDTWFKLLASMDFVNALSVNVGSNYVWANVTHFSTYSFTGDVVDCDDFLDEITFAIEADCYLDNGTYRADGDGFICNSTWQDDECDEDNSTDDSGTTTPSLDDVVETTPELNDTDSDTESNATTSTNDDVETSEQTASTETTSSETTNFDNNESVDVNETNSTEVSNAFKDSEFMKLWIWIILAMLIVAGFGAAYIFHFKEWLRQRKMSK